MKAHPAFLFIILIIPFLAAASAQDENGSNSRTLHHKIDSIQNHSALAFDGIRDVVTIDDERGFYNLNDFTIEAWVYRTSMNTMDVVIAKGGFGEDPNIDTNFTLDIQENNLPRVLWERNDSQNYEVIGTTTILDSQWYHLAGVRSAAENTLTLYVNGIMDGQIATAGSPNTQNLPILLGFNNDGYPEEHHFAGYIDEVRIWRCPRTAEEISTTMLRKLHGNEPALIGYWTFDNDDGQIVIDSSPFGNHGVLGKTTVIEPEDPTPVESDIELADPLPIGPAGYSLDFDGVDDIVTVPDTSKTLDLDDFTIEAWVYRHESGINNMIVSKSIGGEHPSVDSNYWLWIKANDRAEVGWELPNSQNVAVQGETIIEPKKWYHLAGVRSAQDNTLAIYVNGILDAPVLTTSGKPNTQDQALVFGNTPGVNNEYHKGYIDEVRIWRIPRSEGEIQTAMNFRIEPKIHGLAGYWRFDEGEGQTIFDLTPNGNHGYRGETPNPDDADPVWILSTAPINPGPPVPVELVAFEAAAHDGGILLTWRTASESRNAGFHIYRAMTDEAAPALQAYQQITSDMIPGAGTTNQSNDYQWLDSSVEANRTYHYRLAEIDFDGAIAFHGPISLHVNRLPSAFQLHQNYPNPFNPTTTITYDLPVVSEVVIEVFRLDGTLVQTLARGIEPAGTHRLTWQFDGASGVYFYRLRARTLESPQREIVQTRRLMLLR